MWIPLTVAGYVCVSIIVAHLITSNDNFRKYFDNINHPIIRAAPKSHLRMVALFAVTILLIFNPWATIQGLRSLFLSSRKNGGVMGIKFCNRRENNRYERD